ncbi:MAG: acyl-[ACP]--phospholipid O-acyltransferase [Gammaproteobacteria bacterium]
MRSLVAARGFLAFTAVTFINAFVDLGHKIVVQNAILKSYDGSTQIALSAIVNALILLPFVALASPAGFIADKHRKNEVIRAAAWVAVGLTLAITLCYYLGLFWIAFAMTLLLAVQSAIYSPAKYGFIRELVDSGDLATANGVVQAATTVAMLSGTFAFSLLFEQRLAAGTPENVGDIMRAVAPLGWCLVAASVLEAVLAGRLPRGPAQRPDMRFDWVRLRSGQYLRENLAAIRGHSTIFLSIVGLAIFWSLAQVLAAVFPAHAKETLGIDNTVIIQGLLACSGAGIVAGSIIAGRASTRHIETGLVPIGAFGVTATLLLVPILDGRLVQALNFMALGLFGGLFIVPLNALIQYHAPEHERGRVQAANNLVQNLAMLGFLALTVAVAAAGAATGSTGLLKMTGLVALGGALYTVYKLPQALARLVAGAAIARKYPLDVIGFENLPERGGVLLLGNHVSWIDWAVLQTACPRPIRFVMDRGIYERWYLKWFLDLFGVVPIASGASKNALDAVRTLLNAGEVVALFPEGTISRTGHLVEFRRGYERAVEGAQGVIVPFYLRGLWGSWFSRSSERLRLTRRSGVRRDIIVAFGPPLPLATGADTLKQKVFELSIRSWQRHTDTLPTVPSAWLRTVRRGIGDLAVADTLTGTLSVQRFAAAVLCFAGVIDRNGREPNVGILLPTSAAGAIVNMAALLRGRTVVNLNFTASPEAIRAAIRKAGIRTIYTSGRFMERLAQRGLAVDEVAAGARLVKVEDALAGLGALRRLAAMAAVLALPAWLLDLLYRRRTGIDAPAAILFSSGSEGEPKGVVLSHRNILANVKQISDVLNTRDGDVVMATLPLFHAFGLTVTTFMPLVEGIPMVCHADPTDSLSVAKAVATYKGTILCGTSTFLRLYARNQRIHPLMLDSLRIVVAGAEKLGVDVREAFSLKFRKEVLEGYGATETTPVAGVNIPDQIDTTYWTVQRGHKPGTVGMPLPGTSFRIVDPDSLAELPTGQDGLILIGGAQLMLGYLDDPGRTAAAIVELDGMRWYKTGDKGHVDADGFLTIVDRYSRFAKIGGEMVSLTAVETEVRAVVGEGDLDFVAVNVPEPKKGEQIVLMVAGDCDPDALHRTLLQSGMNALMIPARVMQVPAIPKLGTGKTDARLAREQVLAALTAG